MRRITMFLVLALPMFPACDFEPNESDPAEAVLKLVHIERTAEEAVIHADDGEPLWSVPPEDLVMDAEEERKLAAQRCFLCDECHIYPDWWYCTGCVEVPCN